LIWNKKFKYPQTIREAIEGERHYLISNEKLPSVTTILQATQSDEKKASLDKWKQRVGAESAENIKNEAANRGSIMHKLIECYLLDERHMDLTDLGQQADKMAQIIIDEGLKGYMEEIWGTEVCLHYPGLYAGASDLAGVYEGRESIMDFKQSNKPKRREWIEDYFIQLAAYATALLMCTKDNYFQKFTVSGPEFQKYMWEWLRRVDLYYEKRSKLANNHE
jgi:genome maintenance exonuclease 1